jgi:hypothetical protein
MDRWEKKYLKTRLSGVVDPDLNPELFACSDPDP